MAGERPEAAYAARLLERQDGLQAEAYQLVESLDLPLMLGRAGRFERLGSSVSGLMARRDFDLGVSCVILSAEQAWETMVPLAAHPRTTRLSYRNAIGSLAPSELRGYGRAKAPQLRTPREELKYMDNTIDGCTKPRKPIDHTATLSEIVLRGHRSGASR